MEAKSIKFPSSPPSEASDYFSYMNDWVLPFYKEQGANHFLVAADEVKIKVTSFVSPKNKNALLISPGRTEPSMKYAELVYQLWGRGYDIFLIDHRGQGDSSRLLEDIHKGHVGHFDDYIEDFEMFTKWVSGQKKYQHKLLLAHSMGSAISLAFAEENPKYFSGIMLSSPMLGLRLEGIPIWFGKRVLNGLKVIGKGTDYIYNGGAGTSTPGFEYNRVTSCPLRYHMARQLEDDYPHYLVGAPTNNWVLEAIKVTEKVQKHAHKLSAPTLLFQAEHDELVTNQAQDAFLEKILNGRKIHLSGAKHEVLQESDEIRQKVMTEIEVFLSSF